MGKSNNVAIIERIGQLIEDNCETKNAFACRVGINASNFNRKMKGMISFTPRDFAAISKADGISVDWITSGVGEKYINTATSTNENKIEQIDIDRSLLAKPAPYFDVDFALGYGEMFNDTPSIPSQYISMPCFGSIDFWCRTTGTSMQPAIGSGDIIGLREVKDWNAFLPMNETYAIVTKNDIRTVKVIRKGSDDQHLTLHAINNEFDDQEIDKTSILQVFRVIAVLKSL